MLLLVNSCHRSVIHSWHLTDLSLQQFQNFFKPAFFSFDLFCPVDFSPCTFLLCLGFASFISCGEFFRSAVVSKQMSLICHSCCRLSFDICRYHYWDFVEYTYISQYKTIFTTSNDLEARNLVSTITLGFTQIQQNMLFCIFLFCASEQPLNFNILISIPKK